MKDLNEKKREKLEEQLAKKARAIEEYASTIIVRDNTNVIIDGDPYELVENYHDGFQVDKIKERFSPILTKFDYIVGDIGYDQLRLRGFYDNSKKVQPAQKISHLQDYLLEYCNFGCPYFILKNKNAHDSFPTPQRRKNNRKHSPKDHRNKRNSYKRNNIKTFKSRNKRQGSRHFVIRKKKDTKRRK